MFLFFHFLHSNVPDNKSHKQKWSKFFLHASDYWHMYWLVCIQLYESNGTEADPEKVIIEGLQHFAANANCILMHISNAVIHDVLVLNYYEKCSKMQFMNMVN